MAFGPAALSKGNPVNIPEPGVGRPAALVKQGGRHDGNINELGDVGGSPGKSFLFFLTVVLARGPHGSALKSAYLELGLNDW